MEIESKLCWGLVRGEEDTVNNEIIRDLEIKNIKLTVNVIECPINYLNLTIQNSLFIIIVSTSIISTYQSYN